MAAAINKTVTMAAPQVLAQANALGVVLTLSDGELRAKGSKAGIKQMAQHIRACKPELVKLLAPPTTPPPKPTPRFSVHAPWNVADNAYQNHHWQCPQCRVNARTRDREPRCAIGQELYTAYELAAMKGHQ